MRNKLVITAFILSILALATSGVSLLMYISDARGGSGDVQSASAPPANDLGSVYLFWPKSVNDKYPLPGKVYYVDDSGKPVYLGPHWTSNLTTFDDISYDMFSFFIDIDKKIRVKRIGVGAWLTKEELYPVDLCPNEKYFIAPDKFIDES